MSGKAPSTVRMAFSIVIGGFDHLSLNEMLVHNHHNSIFIGPESDHWECLSLTESLTAV